MKTEDKQKFILAEFESSDQDLKQSLQELIKSSENHILLNLLNKNLTESELMALKGCLDEQNKGKKSLIFISDLNDIDQLEDEGFSIAPTLLEAEDLLEMENIERDLGF